MKICVTQNILRRVILRYNTNLKVLKINQKNLLYGKKNNHFKKDYGIM
jgi:hypothetical protein